MQKVACFSALVSMAVLFAIAPPIFGQQPSTKATGKARAMPSVSGMAEDMNMSTMSETNAGHDHPARPVDPALPIPALSHLIFPDAMDGYNVQILSRNFHFTPAAINRAVVANEGHAHIYINDVKILRIYNNWHHLPSSLFSSGVNAVTIILNANDHRS